MEPRATTRDAALRWACVAGGVVAGTATATEYVALRLQFHPHLGPGLRLAAGTRPLCAAAAAIFGAAALTMYFSRGLRHAAVAPGLAATAAGEAWAGALYAPWRIVTWYAAYADRVPRYAPLFRTAALIGVVASVFIGSALIRMCERE